MQPERVRTNAAEPGQSGSQIGQEQPDEFFPFPALPLMLAELTDWFTEHVSANSPGILCEDILGGPDRKSDLGRCGRLLLQT
ncbi:hypothetical protein JCM31598_06260 [Desulfonatronum parangueonense]